MDVNALTYLNDDLELVNDRLSHTVWWIQARTVPSDGRLPIKVTLTLTSDDPTEPCYSVTCCGMEDAVRVLWQLCSIALWLFSIEAFPLPPWERMRDEG